MELFLLRHFESEKNVINKMSLKDDEKLTKKGIENCRQFLENFQILCSTENIKITEVNIANSTRAKESAEIILKQLQNVKVYYWDALKSTKSGNLAGKTLEDIKEEDPFFHYHYMLYRKGLLNLYYMDENWKDGSKESKKEFEKRVLDCFNKIINPKKNDEGVLIIAHRASITAILIEIARRSGFYPNDFYGNIQLTLGGLSWITINNEKININYIDKRI